ncbi:helix-turn-helix domain-containing protein [Maribacter sp. PR1]|uniref:Helix-turn-helix domain-containing protein n=1 Tax=Maribacter cobaltidurans TaxID=1178778 RepID=A0ABU7IRQ9_9FLAO|nr:MULTISPECIES: helix-turn-helix domain-containing protein [Maribacter]MDC6388262.1 helix-turn-helix domain-containing protein [Maribacter sp. PR1]MEE1975650.1 helix-turn-helix domain-containing protein [Maribacter cobaltidurans]
MDQIEQLIENLPIRHNLVSSFMFLGVVQSFFLASVLFLRSGTNTGIKWLAGCMLASAIIFLDTYLCYTGLIKHVMFLNDSTEVLVLLIGPTSYFSIYVFLKRQNISLKESWWHFVIPITYFLSQIPFYFAPLPVKYNAYLGAYYSTLDAAVVPDSFSYGYHYIKDLFDWLVLFSFLLYVILSLLLVWKEKVRLTDLGITAKSRKYIFTRNTGLVLLLLLIFIFSIYYSYDDDGGDHYLGIFHTLITLLTTYVLLSESRFFEKSWIADKYETLSNPKQEINIEAVESYVIDNEYFLNPKASLKDLATVLQIHPNHLSKVINQSRQSNFNDFLNQKRIEQSKKKLIDPNFSNLTIEAIGVSVGFKSKSAFYNAFKKHTGTSPSSFMKSFSPKL